MLITELPPELQAMLVWQNPDIQLLRTRNDGEYTILAQTMQDQLIFEKAQGSLVLPNLQAFKNESIAIFSDYSGESNGNYYTYSVLVCGYNYISLLRRENGCYPAFP